MRLGAFAAACLLAPTALAGGATQASVVCRSPSVVLALDTTSSDAAGFEIAEGAAAIDGKLVRGAITKTATSKALRRGPRADDTFPNLLTFQADGSKTRIGVIIRQKTLVFVAPTDPVELYVSRAGAPEVKEIAHCVWGAGTSMVAGDWLESAACADRCAAATAGGSSAECVKTNCKATPLDPRP